MDRWGTPHPEDAAGAEVLERAGREPRLTSRGRRWVAASMALLAVAGAALWLVEERVRGRDERAVAACRDVAQAADNRSLVTVGFMVDHVEPALLAVREEARRKGLVALVAEAAQRAEPGVVAAVAECERQDTPAPWHPGLRSRRAAYLDYLDARLRWLRLIAADGQAYYRDRPWLAAAREAAFGG
ncbi:hypothetical protein [Nocardioides ferulae]|uniref:hypothetical protein n=1 Tax=Nocardioides ferulae TaxID=2340821 RepID=UPI000EB54FAC|nr:hypothetical protein [Nocardioides ferulae]